MKATVVGSGNMATRLTVPDRHVQIFGPNAAKVTALADKLGVKHVDTGGLANARYLEPLGGLNIYFAHGAGFGTSITPAWLKGS